MLVMGTATVLIGCLPTYDSIGLLVPILLVVLRSIQGFRRWRMGRRSLMVVEYAPEDQRGHLWQLATDGALS